MQKPLLAIAALSIAGCSGGGPTVLVDTGTSVTPIYTPSANMPGGAISAPPGLTPNLLAPQQIVERNGSYRGTAQPLDTGGGLCISTRTVSNFHVRGNSVRFGQFRGTIQPDNSLQMIYGQQWIVGRFDGGTFRGEYDLPQGRFGEPGCSYLMTLQRVGP